MGNFNDSVKMVGLSGKLFSSNFRCNILDFGFEIEISRVWAFSTFSWRRLNSR